MENESDGDTNCNWCSQYSHQRIGAGTGGIGNKSTSGHYPNNSIVKIGQNTEKSPGDLKRLVVAQALVEDNRLTLVWGHDGIHGFWFKKFTSIHHRLALDMNRCLQGAQVPDWMTKGKTTLIQKDPSKGTSPNNYRPITCPPMTWKILTTQIREKIYYSLTSRGLFPDEQKGYRKGSWGTSELLYIEQHILNESKTRRKNLAMAWIDNKKAYDMVQQSWIINCLRIYKISHEVINFIEKTMKTWGMELKVRGRSLAEIKIQRGCIITLTIHNSHDAT